MTEAGRNSCMNFRERGSVSCHPCQPRDILCVLIARDQWKESEEWGKGPHDGAFANFAGRM